MRLEVRDKHKIVAIFSFNVNIMCFRQLMINLLNQTEKIFNTVTFQCYLAIAQPTLGNCRGGSLTTQC